MTSPEQKMRKKRCKSVQICRVEEILRRWDPIGVEPGTMAPADEYDSYAPHMVSMVEAGCTTEQLAAHLEDLATTTIGVGSNPKVSASFAAQIVEAVRTSNTALERTREE
ncbi:MAG: hypothetical protein R2712_26435 [Vicinamibacterales bacterium]